jgi:hypothetical protein
VLISEQIELTLNPSLKKRGTFSEGMALSEHRIKYPFLFAREGVGDEFH